MTRTVRRSREFNGASTSRHLASDYAVATLVYRAKGTHSLVEPGSVLIVLGYVVDLGLILWQSAGQ